MATGFADRYAAEFEEDKHPRDEDGQFTLKVSKIHGPKGEKFENLGGKQQDLFAFRGEKGQMNLFSDAGVPDELLPKHIRKGKPDTYAKDEDPPDSGPQWMTLGGGARALVAEDGTILQGCEGVKGYDLDELDETRDERAAKQEQAEDAGWTSAKSDRARETWEAFKNSDPTHPHFIGLVRHGGKFHAFDESAGKLQEQLGIGDGQTAEFDEDKLPHHMERLIENGHRVAVIDRAEDGTPDLDSDADPEAQQAVAEAHEDVAEQQETKPAAAGFGIEPVHPERLKLTQDGREIGYMNLRVMGDRGYIDDTSIHAASRGQGVMRQLWPQIEQHFRDQGATSIRADVVDPAVGEKVWGPLGFQKEGMSGPVEVYRKHLDSPAADSEQATDKPPSTKRGRLPSTDDPAHHAVAQRFGIPPETVKEILETHPDELSRRDNYFPPNSQRDEVVGPTLDYEPHPLGSAKIDSSQHKAGETDNAYVDFLTEFDPQQLKLSEPEDGMSKSQSVAAYADWIKAGMEPPPISVFDSANGNGNLVSTNRRRVLAAQQAGADKIVGWHGKNNPETGLPLKLGDIKRAYEEAKGQGAAASESDQQEQTPADTAGEADDWNAATQSPAEATDDQLARAIEFASHLHGHHQRNAQSGQITPEQLTSLHDMIDGHVATMQAELERRKHAQDQPADRGNAAASPGGTDDASATGAETRPTSGTAAADPGPTGSLGTRHHDAGQRIAQAPGPVRSLLESLHRLRDTRKTGQVETKELGHEYAREMYDHLKSLRHAGDDFGEVHDLSQELGHGAIGYASPAGNVAMVPPKFKGQDWQVRYTLPHESQQAPAATPADAPSEPAGQGDELELLDDVMEGDAYEGDLPASDAGGGFPWEDAGQDEPPTAPSQQPAYSDAWRDLHAQHQDLVYRTIPHREQQYRQAVSQAQRDQQRFAAKAAEYQSQADQLESVTPRDPAHAVRMKSDRPYAEARRRIDKLRKMSADLDRKADEAKLHPRIEFARQQLAASQSAAEQLAQQKAEAGGALAPEVDPDTGKSISRRAYLAKQRAAGRAVQQGKGVSPRTPLGRAIIAAVGDDPVEQQHFGEVLKEIHANDIDAVRNRNDAIKETLANFGFMGRDAGKFLQAIRKYEDADQFLRKSPLGNKFDQMTEYALTHFGEVLDVAHTRTHDDPESAFFETLQRGLKRVPEPHDDEVVSKALEYYLSSLESSRAHEERLKTDPAYREEMAAIERGDYTFSRQGAKIRYARWARQRLSRWYRYARQLSLFDDPGGLQSATKPKPKGKQKGLFDEDDHPRATEHVEIKGKSYEGGQWIPKDEAAQASPAAAEKIEVVDQDTGQAQPLDEVEEQPSESPGAEPASADPEPFEFKTAAQAAQEGMSFASWQQPITDAYRHERIDEDHPAWQAVLNAPNVSDYNDARHVFGKHVLAHAGQQEVFGTVTALSDDLQSGTITMPDGREAKHFISNMNDLGPFLQDRLKRYIATKGLDETREALARSEAAKYLAGVMAQEAFQKQTNIGEVIKAHGFGLKEGMAIRSMVADEFMKLQEAAKPQASDARKRAQEKRRQTDEAAEKKPDDTATSAGNYEGILQESAPYEEYGDNYNRNIAASANRLRDAMERGHDAKMLDHLASELRTRIDVHGKKPQGGGEAERGDKPDAAGAAAEVQDPEQPAAEAVASDQESKMVIIDK